MPRDNDSTVFVFNRTKQTFLADRVEVADSMLGRLVGLLGRRSLAPGGGLWIFPSRGIHTWGMVFAIDVVFLDRDLRVVALREVVRPFSITSINLSSESVIELPAYTIFKSRTEVGDELVISSLASELAPEMAGPLPDLAPTDTVGTP